MARSALLFDEIEDRVTVTVDADLLEALNVAAGTALMPEFVPTAGVVVRLARLAALFERLLGDVGQHQHLPRSGVLCDRGQQLPFVEGEIDAH